eukprot:TRINITY_DN21794_c0_g1_i2.p1 TRINITY_DN21794_c0_g1~~TRINITY_DN21794_c0_g1_i2.p1  ORF type:complete len:152 (+),score=18.37 TRINITY_DN21794_c0_g1_i2:32-457(+)
MGVAWGYTAFISDGMEAAIRKEATYILVNGTYMRGSWCRWGAGASALSTVCKAVYDHKDDGSAMQLFSAVASELPLKHPLEMSDLQLCDLQGCVTVGDVACILMQRIIVTTISLVCFFYFWGLFLVAELYWGNIFYFFWPL